MLIRIIHIVSSLDKINYGIWNAALLGVDYLLTRNVKSFLWVCSDLVDIPSEVKLPVIFIGRTMNSLKKKEVLILEHQDFSIDNTIIVTHGSWGMPSRIGYYFKRKGYRWIYTPHGMLEPWSMNVKKFKKKIYFNLFEKRMATRADKIRAVSRSEQLNLKVFFEKEIILIENGIQLKDYKKKNNGTKIFLFMARLHYKKGILPLVKAWNKHMRDADVTLIIAGPDEGELEKVQPFIGGNSSYVGPVYGVDKEKLLHESHYYILPSFSEGFPTSVVEGMGHGLIPLISPACNFPQVFENRLGYSIDPDEESISRLLLQLVDLSFDEKLSLKNYQFIKEHNTEGFLGDKLWAMYNDLLQTGA